jgi:MYXO-CTERM domain-containing protein
LLPLTSALLVSTASGEAQACGGLFCDGGNPMPVDQAGEEVIFVEDGDTRETHIRILYQGEAENFAWVIPMTSDTTPEFSVGSDAFFTRLGLDSAPSFPVSNVGGEEQCNGWGGTEGGGYDGGFAGSEGDEGGGPNIEAEGTVGSFEFAVLSGGTVESVVQWLDDNGYQQDPEAEPILGAYIDAGAKLAAVKLSADASADAIHPIVVRYQGPNFCVPIELTRIAAQDDMGIRLYGLDSRRLAPLNYDHVVPNYLRLDVEDYGFNNYEELVTMAVDEAGGHAFITEYSGSSAVVNQWGLWESSWNTEVFAEIEPAQVTNELQSQGFFNQPMLVSIMRQYLPVPDGLEENDFWNNLDYYADQIDLDAWDGPAFAAALETLIVAPGKNAVDILQTRPLLTRMYTTISPQEMTEDPLFFFREGLDEVPMVHPFARESDCDERGKWTAEGHEFCETTYDDYPTIADLPWAARIERIPATGAPQVTSDNAEAIGVAVDAHNEATCGQEHEPGEFDGESGSSGGQNDAGSKGSCACTSDSSTGGGSAALLLLALGFVRRRED